MYEKIFPGIQLEHNQIETESEKNIEIFFKTVRKKVQMNIFQRFCFISYFPY